MQDNGRKGRNVRGISNVLAHLERSLGQQKPVQKGEALEKFFESAQRHRRRGERSTDWLVRFNLGLGQLRENDVNFNALDDVASWFPAAQGRARSRATRARHRQPT